MSSTVSEQPGAPASDATKRCAAMKISPPPLPPPSVDIDGVPLRDGQKIDLKHLLGHMPEIDDDEEEELALAAGGDGDKDAASAAAHLIETQFQPVDDDDLIFGEPCDDDDDAEDGDTGMAAAAVEPVQRKRRSSLKRCILHEPQLSVEPPSVSPEPPQSPDHSQKAVRFADAVGLGLADVRDLVNADEPPTIPASALRDLHVRRRKRSKSHLIYSLDFSQPGSDPTFITRVLADKVSVSRYSLFSLHIQSTQNFLASPPEPKKPIILLTCSLPLSDYFIIVFFPAYLLFFCVCVSVFAFNNFVQPLAIYPVNSCCMTSALACCIYCYRHTETNNSSSLCIPSTRTLHI